MNFCVCCLYYGLQIVFYEWVFCFIWQIEFCDYMEVFFGFECVDEFFCGWVVVCVDYCEWDFVGVGIFFVYVKDLVEEIDYCQWYCECEEYCWFIVLEVEKIFLEKSQDNVYGDCCYYLWRVCLVRWRNSVLSVGCCMLNNCGESFKDLVSVKKVESLKFVCGWK